MNRNGTGRCLGSRPVDHHERTVFVRVLDALLREDHLGLASRGRLMDDGWWQVETTTDRLRFPVRPDGFQHPIRTASPFLLVEAVHPAPGTGVRRISTLDDLLALLAPIGDPEAIAGWAAFTTECHAELTTRRLADRTRSRVHAWIEAARIEQPTGMGAALLDEVLAARADHPVHPTSRARHGLSDDELLRYAPEHATTFPLRWLPVHRNGLTLTGELPSWWPPSTEPDHLLLPVHPITATQLRLPVDDHPRLQVRPTLSMRTVALADDPYTHLKLPLTTATLGARNRRTIAPDTLADGAALQRLLQRIAAAEPTFAGRILHADESRYGHAGDDIRAFLVRRYPAELASRTVVPVAALAAADPTGGTVLERISRGDPVPLLTAYLDLLIDWHVCLWLRYGIALEAHQQNIHLVIEPDGGVRLLYKDNDGARLDRRHDVVLRDHRMIVTDPGELADVFTTITLHLAAAAPLLALARRGLPVPSPAAALRQRLAEARDRWADGSSARLFTERLLDAGRLPVKAMLTAGTLLPKQRLGSTDINKHYLRTGPNYLRSDR